MISARSGLSCIAHPNNFDIVYAIGGAKAPTELLISIEEITIESGISEVIGDLSEPAMWTRAVVYLENIYVLGGVGSSNYLDTVHIIETDTNTVSLLDDTLSYAVHSPATIAVNNVLYAFGGSINVDNVFADTWMKYTLYVSVFLILLNVYNVQ